MTDERAIDILQATMGTSPIEGQSEANEMAIKALEDKKALVKESAIKELERIRNEIEALDKWGQTFHRYNMALGDCIDIINEHIEELKGEQE